MDKLITSGRLLFMAALTAFLLIAADITLYKLQIVEGERYARESRDSLSSTIRVTAARGNIMDRYGRVLIENRVCNNLLIDTNSLFGDQSAAAIAKANETILRLTSAVTAYGDTYNDTLPVTRTPPFEYTEMTAIQRATLNAYLKERKLGENATAVELMAYMRNRYSIDNS